MNLRQKAKHFKRLYEQKKPFPVVYEYVQPIHYKAVYSELGDVNTIAYSELHRQNALRHLISQAQDVLKDSMIENYDAELDRTVYTLDIWLRCDRK